MTCLLMRQINYKIERIQACTIAEKTFSTTRCQVSRTQWYIDGKLPFFFFLRQATLHMNKSLIDARENHSWSFMRKNTRRKQNKWICKEVKEKKREKRKKGNCVLKSYQPTLTSIKSNAANTGEEAFWLCILGWINYLSTLSTSAI